MFAVIRTGGKQYTVKAGDVLNVELLEGKAGDKIKIEDVLVAGTKIGSAAKGTVVNAEIVGETKGDKVIIFKKKRRQNYRRKNGHTQHFTQIKITDIK